VSHAGAAEWRGPPMYARANYPMPPNKRAGRGPLEQTGMVTGHSPFSCLLLLDSPPATKSRSNPRRLIPATVSDGGLPFLPDNLAFFSRKRRFCVTGLNFGFFDRHPKYCAVVQRPRPGLTSSLIDECDNADLPASTATSGNCRFADLPSDTFSSIPIPALNATIRRRRAYRRAYGRCDILCWSSDSNSPRRLLPCWRCETCNARLPRMNQANSWAPTPGCLYNVQARPPSSRERVCESSARTGSDGILESAPRCGPRAAVRQP